MLAILGVFMSEPAFLAWGWRIPFLLSAVLVVVGMLIGGETYRRGLAALE